LKTAVVGLNSLYACGVTSFMLHLTYDSDWDLIIYSSDVLLTDLVPPKSFKEIIRVYDGATLSKVLSRYDNIIFAASRWGGDYSFLEETAQTIKLILNLRVGIIIYDETEFARMGMGTLIEMFPYAKILCHDDTVAYKFRKYDIQIIKHPYDIRMLTPDKENDDNTNYMICATRFTPSKNIKCVVGCSGNYKLKMFGADKDSKDISFCNRSNVELHYGVYSFESIAREYLGAKAVLDGSVLPSPVRRTQYSFMDAWRFYLPILCDRSWMGNELIDGVNCLELSRENVDMIWNNPDIGFEIGINGNKTLLSNHNPKDVRDRIMEILDGR